MLDDGELEEARFELEKTVDGTKNCQQDSNVHDAGEGKNEAVMEHYWLQRQKVEEAEA